MCIAILVPGKKLLIGYRKVPFWGNLLDIFVNDLFLFVSSSNLNNYADDNTLYTPGYNLKEIEEVLLNDLNKVTELFFENCMVLNAGECHFMCLGKKTENETFIFKDTIMNNGKEEKILGVIIGNRLTLAVTSENYVKELLKRHRLCQEYQTSLMILKKSSF